LADSLRLILNLLNLLAHLLELGIDAGGILVQLRQDIK